MRTYALEDRGSTPLYEYLYRCIREDILAGALAAGERLPLPIMPRRPCCKSVGVEESMRVEVVGPMEPTGRPGGVGVGPA